MIKINLLPVKQTKKRGVGQQQVALFAVILVLFGIGLYVVYGAEKGKLDRIDKEKQSVQAEISRLQELIGDIESFQKKRADLAKKVDVIENLKKGKTGPVRLLDEISTLIPKKVWMTSLREGDGKLYFDGQALDNRDVAVFMKALEGSKFFTNVTLISVKRDDKAQTGAAKASPSMAATQVMAFQIVCSYSIPQQS